MTLKRKERLRKMIIKYLRLFRDCQADAFQLEFLDRGESCSQSSALDVSYLITEVKHLCSHGRFWIGGHSLRNS